MWNLDMVLIEITRHAAIVETALLSRQPVIDHPLFMQVPIGNSDHKTSRYDCQEQKSDLIFVFIVRKALTIFGL
jgi:hypothetical protein